MNEINDYLIIDDIKIEIKSFIHKNSTLEPIVFLHEGLGSIALWKNFPKEIYNLTKRDVIIYSRIGMGNSSALKKPRKTDYMHQEAIYYLPKILNFLNIKIPILLGHSDGASIALIYAGSGNKVKSMILEAPHVFVEDISIKGIKDAKKLWSSSDLKDKLKKYHKDPDGAFNGWCNAWLSKEFYYWNIEDYLNKIYCPMLLIQGKQDTYGTIKQIESIENNSKGIIKRYELENCGHSPHSQYPKEIANKINNFLNNN